MKKLALIVTIAMLSSQAQASADLNQPMCKVEICNKIERFTLSIGSFISDQMGEKCDTVIMPKSDAIVDKVLSSESRWYQGSSINPTKKSVTRVSRVLECQAVK